MVVSGLQPVKSASLPASPTSSPSFTAYLTLFLQQALPGNLDPLVTRAPTTHAPFVTYSPAVLPPSLSVLKINYC